MLSSQVYFVYCYTCWIPWIFTSIRSLQTQRLRKSYRGFRTLNNFIYRLVNHVTHEEIVIRLAFDRKENITSFLRSSAAVEKPRYIMLISQRNKGARYNFFLDQTLGLG